MKYLVTFCLSVFISTLAISQESLSIHWPEKYEWKLLSNQENEEMHVMEVIPGKESADDWTLIGQMMSLKGSTDIPVETAASMMYEQTKSSSPEAKMTLLDKDADDKYPWVLFKIENPYFNDDDNPESQLWYIRQGSTSLYMAFVAKREAELDQAFMDEWTEVFLSSEMIFLGKKGKKKKKK